MGQNSNLVSVALYTLQLLTEETFYGDDYLYFKLQMDFSKAQAYCITGVLFMMYVQLM